MAKATCSTHTHTHTHTHTLENERDIDLNFEFLDEGKTYKAVMYHDGEDAHWNDNPTSYLIDEMEVDQSTTMTVHLAPGGGLAISLIEVTP